MSPDPAKSDALPPDFDPLHVEADWDSTESIVWAVARAAYERGRLDATTPAQPVEAWDDALLESERKRIRNDLDMMPALAGREAVKDNLAGWFVLHLERAILAYQQAKINP